MTFNTLKLECDSGVGILTLNRPQKLNCFNHEMHSELRAVFEQINNELALRCLVLTGAGKGFCAGQDLNERQFDPNTHPDLGASLQKNYNPLVRNIMTLDMPVICAVNGIAAGAGAAVALACDIVLAARSAGFILSFCKIGLAMDSASSWNLPRQIGLPRAKGMALLGQRIDAKQAEDWGLIWKCIEDDKLMDEAVTMGKELAVQPTRALALIKRELLASTSNSLEEQLALEAELQTTAGHTNDYREGVQAFLEKRKPDFKGN